MSDLLDKMNQQFTDMHKLALDFEAMAHQAIIERDKARDALRECVTDSGAAAFGSFDYAERRLLAINETVKSILGDK